MHQFTQADALYLSAATKMSGILGRKFGVTVTFGGHPRTNGNEIVLPHWDLSTPEARAALYGCVAHEAGGHVRMTNFDRFRRAVDDQPPRYAATYKSLLNILEDVRIEKELAIEYPGVTYYLDAVARHYLVSEPPMTDTSAFWPVMLSWLLYALRFDVLRQDLLRDHVEATTKALLADGIVTVRQMDELHAIGSKIAKCGIGPHAASTVCAIATELFDYLLALSQSQSGSQGDQDGSQGQSGSQGDQDGSQGQSGSQGGSGGAGGKCRSQIDCKPLSAEMGDVVSDAIAAEMQNHDRFNRYRDFASVGAAHFVDSSVSSLPAASFLKDAVPLVGRFTQAISPLLIGESFDEQRLKSGSRLDERRLTQALTSSDPAIFKRRVIEDDQSVAVHVLVDNSSSTNMVAARGWQIHRHLLVASLALVRALEAFPEVKCAISGFPGTRGLDCATIYPIKRSDTSLTGKSCCPAPFGTTPMGEAVLSAGIDLLSVDKQRRIILVLTDGKPNDTHKAIHARQVLNGLGIEVLGLVIGGNPAYPTNVFDQSVFVTDVADLPRELLTLVQNLLKH